MKLVSFRCHLKTKLATSPVLVNCNHVALEAIAISTLAPNAPKFIHGSRTNSVWTFKNDANRALLSGNLPPKWQFALLLFFSFHSHQRKLSKKKKREIVLLNGSDGWLITHHKSSDHLFLPWLFTSILFEKQILLLKSPVFITDGAGSQIQSCAKFFLFSLPLTNAPRFSHAFQHFSCAIVDGSMTFFKNFWRRQKRHLFITLDFDNLTTRLDFLTVDAFLYFSSFVSSFLKISSHCIYCHSTNRLALWVDPIDLTIKRDDIIVPYYYFWKKKKQKKKNKTKNILSNSPICKGEWLSAWLA